MWGDRLHTWRQRQRKHVRRKQEAMPVDWPPDAEVADGDSDDDLYAFAHTEAEAFPRAWDDVCDDYEDEDVFD